MRLFKHKTPELPINNPWRVFYKDNQNQLLFQHYFVGKPKVGGYVKRYWPEVTLKITGVNEASREVYVCV